MKLKSTIVILTSLLLYSNIVYAQSNQASNQTTKKTIQNKSPQIPLIYQQAKSQLSSEFYELYRIEEKLIRANGLSEYSWKITINNNENKKFLAVSGDGNLVQINDNLLLSNFSGDLEALAFTLSHIIAHQKLDFVSKMANLEKESNANIQSLNDDLLNIVEKLKVIKSNIIELNSNINNYNDQARTSYTFQEKLRNIRQANDYKSRLKLMEQQATAFIADINQIKLQKSNIQNNYKDFLFQQQQEADNLALMYMLRAGYNPEGAYRIINFIGRMPSLYEYGVHPVSQDRIKNMESKLQTIEIDVLQKEGKENMANSTPLSFTFFPEKNTLRINSKFNKE